MKKYKLLERVLTGGGKPDEFIGSKMFEDPEGLWVKWEDVEKETIEAYKSGYFTGQNSEWANPNKCNCQRELEQPTGLRCREIVLYDCWICPVHGYKRR